MAAGKIIYLTNLLVYVTVNKINIAREGVVSVCFECVASQHLGLVHGLS